MHSFLSYIQFYLKAKTLHNIHSPFVFEFTKKVIEDERYYYAFDEIEKIRQNFLNDQRRIKIKDYGAGSKVMDSDNRQISEIARHSVSTTEQIQTLFRIIQFFKPDRILEFGTSLGLSAFCMQLANPNAEVITIEGDKNLSKIASKLFIKHQMPIQLIHEKFQTMVESLSRDKRVFNCFYLDGQHSYSATKKYVDLLTDRLVDNGLIIIDDIYWSKQMTNAWNELRRDKRFTLSIDLFYKGILIKNPAFEKKQHFRIIPRKNKPLSLGLWA